MVGLTARRWRYGVAHWSFVLSGMGSWWPLSPIRDATWTLMHERDQWINENSGEMQARLVCCVRLASPSPDEENLKARSRMQTVPRPEPAFHVPNDLAGPSGYRHQSAWQ